MALYEVAILEKPTKKDADEGAQEKLICGPTAIVACDERAAAICVAAGSDAVKKVDPARLEVLVRPFGD